MNEAIEILKKNFKKQNKKEHLTVFKDFDQAEIQLFEQPFGNFNYSIKLFSSRQND